MYTPPVCTYKSSDSGTRDGLNGGSMPIPRTQEDHHKAELRVQEQEVKVSLQLYSCAKHGTRYMILSPLYSSLIFFFRLLSSPLLVHSSHR